MILNSKDLEDIIKYNNISQFLNIFQTLSSIEKYELLLYCCFWDNLNIFKLIYDHNNNLNNNIINCAISENSNTIIDYLLENYYKENINLIDIKIVLKYKNKKILNIILQDNFNKNLKYIKDNIKDFLFSPKIVNLIINDITISKNDILEYFILNSYKYNLNNKDIFYIIKKLSYYIEYEKKEIKYFKYIKTKYISKKYFQYTINRSTYKPLTDFFKNQYFLYLYIRSIYNKDISNNIYSFFPISYSYKY
jgi:hypothetical protein